MAIIQCSGCDSEVNTQSIKCANCGTPIGYIGGTSVGQERILAAEQAATQRGAEQTTLQRATASPTSGVALLRAGNYEEAIEAFTDYIASQPNQPSHYRNRAEAYQALGRRSEAQADYTRVAQLDKARSRPGHQATSRSPGPGITIRRRGWPAHVDWSVVLLRRPHSYDRHLCHSGPWGDILLFLGGNAHRSDRVRAGFGQRVRAKSSRYRLRRISNSGRAR